MKVGRAASRKQNEDDLDAKLTSYTIGCERYELMNRLQARGIPAWHLQPLEA